MLLALEAEAFVSNASVSRTQRRLRRSRKIALIQAGEADPLLQAVFMHRVGRLVSDLCMLMFADESAKNERTVIQRYAYGAQGQRVPIDAPFVRGKRYSIRPILTLGGIISQKAVGGSITAEIFESFLREHVVRPHPFFSFLSSLAVHRCC